MTTKDKQLTRDIGKKIKTLRKLKGISVEQLAKSITWQKVRSKILNPDQLHRFHFTMRLPMNYPCPLTRFFQIMQHELPESIPLTCRFLLKHTNLHRLICGKS